MLRAIGSPKAVYELRSTPLFTTILIAIFLGIAHMTPFTIRFFSISPYRFDLQFWELDYVLQEQLLQNLPEDCYIADFTFTCGEEESFTIGERISIHFNEVHVDIAQGIVFLEQQFIFVADDQEYVLSYGLLNDLKFGYLQNLDNGYDILFERIAGQLRGILVIPFVLGAYQTGIMTYFIYILGISILSMLLKFGHANFISFKEMINIMVFASFLPIVAVVIIGFFTPAFSTIIFNWGTPLWAFIVYKKYVIPGLQGSPIAEIGKKECE